MKAIPIYLLAMLSASALHAEPEKVSKAEILKQHAEGAGKVADEQDELSADVQQLVIEQTLPEVIELLSKVEGIMDETTDYLSEPDTGGRTIAAQTEIIEAIHQAAKAKQQKSGKGEQGAGGAMMDMMEKMMGEGEGKEGKGKGKGKGKGEGEGEGEGEGGEKGGTGKKGGESNSDNDTFNGNGNGSSSERRVPKAAGNTGKSLPSEFQSALDAYNRGMEELEK
ncbi:MAG: hypothetical protein V4727_10260 [Verrucomicrobiota bacterium]